MKLITAFTLLFACSAAKQSLRSLQTKLDADLAPSDGTFGTMPIPTPAPEDDVSGEIIDSRPIPTDEKPTPENGVNDDGCWCDNKDPSASRTKHAQAKCAVSLGMHVLVLQKEEVQQKEEDQKA